MKCSISPIEPAEVPVVEAMSLSHLSHEEQQEYLKLAAKSAERISRILSGQTGICLVARQDGLIIGYVYGDAKADQISPVRYAELLNIYVLPAYRRRGAGRQLGIAFVDWAKRSGYTRIAVKTGWRKREELLDFYQSFSFKPMTIELELHFNE